MAKKAGAVMFDLLIKNGTVVDGSGFGSYRADVGREGRIVFVGRPRETGRQEIDAEGHVVTPGFIDGHTHLDAQVFWDPIGASSCWHGVTTVVMGNCGFTLAPVRDGRTRRWSSATWSGPRTSTPRRWPAGINWGWESFPGVSGRRRPLPKRPSTTRPT